MNKKKTKRKFKRKNIKFRNIGTEAVNELDGEKLETTAKAHRKIQKKGIHTNKSNAELEEGLVIEVFSNNTANVEIDGKLIACTIGGRLRNINYQTKNVIAIGDIVRVDTVQKDDSSLLRIEEIKDRHNSLSRFSDSEFQLETIIAANIDNVIITASWKNPEINLGLVDRYLCIAELSDIHPVICINKIDLAEDLQAITKLTGFYIENGYDVVLTSAHDNMGINELRSFLADKSSVFSGHSGAGKSTLINRLHPGLNLRTSEISENTGKGVHTTTSSRLIRWDFGGFLVDTPGIKTLGLHKEDFYDIPKIFPGFWNLKSKCKYADCRHIDEVECGVKMAVEKGLFPEERYESYLRIMESLK